MAEVVLVKDEFGKLAGLGEAGGRAYARFLALVTRLEIGETLKMQFWEPRAPGFHKRFFLKLAYLFDMQEQFIEPDHLRGWLTVGAGEADLLPGPKGRLVAIPKSIAWHKLDEAEFRELSRRIDDFLWTEPAHAFLWPHLAIAKRYEMLDGMQQEFAQPAGAVSTKNKR